MPANLPPEYFDAEKRFKQASSPARKVLALEELIATIPKHKGTDELRGDLRRKLSQLRKEAETIRRSRKGGKGELYVVQREGAAQVALVGFPNSGKSSLLASLTNATPVIAEYPISTLIPLPGMMPYEDIQGLKLLNRLSLADCRKNCVALLILNWILRSVIRIPEENEAV